MRKYYTRPCNFYYGDKAKKIVKNKKGLYLAGNPNIAFDQIEVFQRKNKNNSKSNTYSIEEIKTLNKDIKFVVKNDFVKYIKDIEPINIIE